MSADILAKLKIKNMPATKENIAIHMPNPIKKWCKIYKINRRYVQYLIYHRK